MSPRQERRIVLPRQIAMYLIHELLGDTLKGIAQLFGKKDHTTVLYALEKIGHEIEEQTTPGREATTLRARLKETTR
jgi:chromosomal replication initiator protein